MTARRLDGTATAAVIKAELRERVVTLTERGIVPGLGTLLVGADPGSISYVTGKHRDCAEVGVASIQIELPDTATQGEIVDAVRALNENPAVTAFIVQLPLPDGVDTNIVLEAIDPDKDADGLHPMSLGRLVLGADQTAAPDAPLPCTPRGIVELLARHDVALAGKRVVVIGRGVTVGRPLALLLSRKGIDATVILTHSRTRELEKEVAHADVVIAALGVPHFVKPEWIKPGAVVLDVGVTRDGSSPSGKARILGDVAPGVTEVADWLSPNPGGVGPMTRAVLVANVIETAERAERTRTEGDQP